MLGGLSFIPGLQLVTGPPGAAVLGGGIATAAGLGMVALGKALGGGKSAEGSSGSSGGSAASTTRTSSGGGFRAGRLQGPSLDDAGFRGGLGGGSRPIERTIIINFNAPVGDRRAAGREILDLISDAGGLVPVLEGG